MQLPGSWLQRQSRGVGKQRGATGTWDEGAEAVVLGGTPRTTPLGGNPKKSAPSLSPSPPTWARREGHGQDIPPGHTGKNNPEKVTRYQNPLLCHARALHSLLLGAGEHPCTSPGEGHGWGHTGALIRGQRGAGNPQGAALGDTPGPQTPRGAPHGDPTAHRTRRAVSPHPPSFHTFPGTLISTLFILVEALSSFRKIYEADNDSCSRSKPLCLRIHPWKRVAKCKRDPPSPSRCNQQPCSWLFVLSHS